MSLNNNQMLPARIRSMRQMNDVLNAEDIVLAEIERIIDDMYQRASLLHEELVNESWLEGKLVDRTGASAKVINYAEQLLVQIVLDVSRVFDVDIHDVRQFLNKWLPAHLMYKLIFMFQYETICPEKFILHQLRCELNACFWGAILLDGVWLLNGKNSLNFVRGKTDCGCIFDISSFGIGGEQYLGVVLQKNLWVLDGSCELDGVRMLDAERREELIE